CSRGLNGLPQGEACMTAGLMVFKLRSSATRWGANVPFIRSFWEGVTLAAGTVSQEKVRSTLTRPAPSTLTITSNFFSKRTNPVQPGNGGKYGVNNNAGFFVR